MNKNCHYKMALAHTPDPNWLTRWSRPKTMHECRNFWCVNRCIITVKPDKTKRNLVKLAKILHKNW